MLFTFVQNVHVQFVCIRVGVFIRFWRLCVKYRYDTCPCTYEFWHNDLLGYGTDF